MGEERLDYCCTLKGKHYFVSAPSSLVCPQQLLTTYRESKDAAQNLERVRERMEEDGLQPDVTTYNHILDL